MPYLSDNSLYRQNALRRATPPTSPINSSFTFPHTNNHHRQNTAEELVNLKSRIMSYQEDEEEAKSIQSKEDTEVLNKACSLKNANQITSNYWKIPDHNYSYLTLVSSHNDKPYLALSNSSNDSNLLIYELNAEKKLLSHHQSITLPNITSLKWLDSIYCSDNDERNDINFLLSGHSKGHIHLSIIPEPENDVFHNAEIIKRFNHNKHIDLSLEEFSSSSITKMEISPRRWRSCNMNSLLSIYKSNIFMWDTSRSRAPILKHKSVGIKNFNPSPCNDGLLGICGEFGIALLDLRAQDNSPSFYVPNSKNLGVANNIKWSPFDANVLASSYEDGVVKLWDVRMTKNSFAKLEGHRDIVTSIEWSESSTNDLFTSSKDGNIIHWDLNDVSNYSAIEDELKCGLRVGLDSVNLVNKNGKIELVKDLISTRQCGTVVPASNNSIVDLVNIGDGKILSIDGSSFLGLHNKTIKKTQESDKMMNEILSSINESEDVSGLEEDTSSLESLILPKTPRSHQSELFASIKSNETLLNSTAPPSPTEEKRISSTTSTTDTLVESPVIRKESHFQTLPLPYYHKIDRPISMTDIKLDIPKARNAQHKKSLSMFIKQDKKLRATFRDLSGRTLKEEDEDEDLLTDLSIEDGFTFQPVFPLSVNKTRPTC